MKLKASTSRLDVEHGIRPLLQRAVTLPVTAKIDDAEIKVVVYVGTSVFATNTLHNDADIRDIATEVARRINQE